MSSLRKFTDPTTGVSVDWNKQGPWTCTVPRALNDEGWMVEDAHTTSHESEEAAMKAARRLIPRRKAELDAMTAQQKRYRVQWLEGYGDPAPAAVVVDRTYFDGDELGYTDHFRAEVDALAYPGCEYDYMVFSEHIRVTRIR